MSIRSLGFLAREASMNIGRHGLMTIASISTVAISLTILGGFVLMAFQFHSIAQALPQQMEIHAFARTDLTRAASEAVVARLRVISGVVRVRLVPKEEAWLAFQKGYANKADLAGLPGNPMPDKFEIRTTKPEQIERVAGVVRSLPQVARVNTAPEVLQNMLRIARLVRLVGLVCAGLLLLATVAVISNSIRITLFARRREIRIMQLVGATNGFIRLPFVFEGIFDGAAGAALACVVVTTAYQYLVRTALANVPLLNEFHTPVSLPPLFGGLAAIGVAIGALGSLVTMRRFLRIS
jgi:cell division transport system permease protein